MTLKEMTRDALELSIVEDLPTALLPSPSRSPSGWPDSTNSEPPSCPVTHPVIEICQSVETRAPRPLSRTVPGDAIRGRRLCQVARAS